MYFVLRIESEARKLAQQASEERNPVPGASLRRCEPDQVRRVFLSPERDTPGFRCGKLRYPDPVVPAGFCLPVKRHGHLRAQRRREIFHALELEVHRPHDLLGHDVEATADWLGHLGADHPAVIVGYE